MGKTTNQFMDNISSLTQQCTGPMFALAEATRQYSQVLKEHAQAMLKHDERVRALDEGTRGGQQNDEAIARDSQCQKLEKQMDAFFNRGGELKQAMKTAVSNLNNVAVPLRKEVAKFETYVDTKSKSKNVFKSKKSLPSARSFITGANKTLDDIDQLIAAAR